MTIKGSVAGIKVIKKFTEVAVFLQMGKDNHEKWGSEE